MKKIFTLLSIIFFTLQIGVCFAQSFEVYDSEGEIINGKTIQVITSHIEPVEYSVKIKNITNEEVTAKIYQKIVGVGVEGITAYLCSPSTELSIGECIMESNETPPFILKANEISQNANLDFTQGSNPGTTVMEYKVVNVSNAEDFVSFYIEYKSPNSIIVENAKSLNIYPNPATTNFTINYEFDTNSYIEIYNVLGKVVEKINPMSGSSYKVDCAKWEKGYYFCRVINNNKVEKTIKIVISR